MKILLDNGALIDLPAGRDGFALHAAAAQGHVDVVKVLLGRGADVQIQGGQFRFALTAGKLGYCPQISCDKLLKYDSGFQWQHADH